MAIDYTTDFLAFLRDLYPMESIYGPKPIIPPFLERWLQRCFPLPGGDPAARNILDSRPKKQGKSALAGAVALYLASRKRYSEVAIIAADQDQSRDRVLRSIKFAVDNNKVWRGSKVNRDVIELNQGSTIQAYSSDWRGAAGGNYAAVICDELHTYTLENQRRLFDEMVIPPTQPAGMRWIASYAGFIGESVLLEEIWNKAMAGEREPGGLPIFSNPGASLLALIDQGPVAWRMKWTTPEYISTIQESERPNTFRRLWLNEWVENESQFVTPEQWQACYSLEVLPLAADDKRRVIFGADASTTRDLTALVGVYSNPETKTRDVVYCKLWQPVKGRLRRGKPTVDLDETIKAEILRLREAGNVAGVVYDPYQLHSIALDLEKSGIRMIELPQTTARTESDQALYDAILGHSIRHSANPQLTEHIKNAVAVETPRGFRLAKEKTTRKIDAAVALSMAHFIASREGSNSQCGKR